MGGLDPDVVEAACLAHDLGHPPFGHVAEMELNRLVTKRQLDGSHESLDGFEGNAQTFRIVTELSVRYPTVPGLNLTRATLAATTKYPWRRGTSGMSSKKWGAYSSEASMLEWSREHLPQSLKAAKTLEAQLMDWADDVAYAVHDLEDFYRAGVIPLERLVTDEGERARFLDGYLSRNGIGEHRRDDLDSAFGSLLDGFPSEPFQGSLMDKATLRSMTSTLVGRYVSAITFDDQAQILKLNPAREIEVKLLKHLTWHYVIESRALISQRYGHASLIKGLFETLLEAASSKDESQRELDIKILPEYFREQIVDQHFDDNVIFRVVADAISSMSEAQAVGLYNRLLGFSLGSALDPILN
jgi:dGTPase